MPWPESPTRQSTLEYELIQDDHCHPGGPSEPVAGSRRRPFSLCRMLQRTVPLILLACLAVSCGSDDESPKQDPAKAPEAAATAPETPEVVEMANPVEILRKVDGCELPAGSEVGETDINGNRYASCDFMDNSGTAGTSVTARTYPGNARDFATLDQLQGDDSTKVILGEDFTVTVTGDFATYSAEVDPEDIADQVGGQFLPLG